jgi:hypothetical protein
MYEPAWRFCLTAWCVLPHTCGLHAYCHVCSMRSLVCCACSVLPAGRGRHAPRSRTAADEGHASAPLAQSLMVIEDGDAGWLDFFDAQDLPGPGQPPAALRGGSGGAGSSSVPGSAGPSGGGAASPPVGVFGVSQRSTSSTGACGVTLCSSSLVRGQLSGAAGVGRLANEAVPHIL